MIGLHSNCAILNWYLLFKTTIWPIAHTIFFPDFIFVLDIFLLCVIKKRHLESENYSLTEFQVVELYSMIY